MFPSLSAYQLFWLPHWVLGLVNLLVRTSTEAKNTSNFAKSIYTWSAPSLLLPPCAPPST
jgi:hypothetical protein